MHTETRCEYDAFLESKLCCDHRNEEHGGPFYVVWEDGGGSAVGREGYFLSYISRLFWRAAKTQKGGGREEELGSRSWRDGRKNIKRGMEMELRKQP